MKKYGKGSAGLFLLVATLLIPLISSCDPLVETPASFSITFDANTGTGTMEAQSLVSGTATALTANTFAKSGSSFAGWASTAEGAVEYADEALYTISTADVTLYAKWTVNTYTTAPSIVSSSIANGATGVDINTASISIVFDQDMKSDMSIGLNQAGLFGNPGAEWLDLRTLRINFSRVLSPGFTYEVKLNPTGSAYDPIANTSGFQIPANTLISFTTPPYLTAPSIVSSTIANGATGVDSNTASISIVFDQDMTYNKPV